MSESGGKKPRLVAPKREHAKGAKPPARRKKSKSKKLGTSKRRRAPRNFVVEAVRWLIRPLSDSIAA